MPGSSAALAGPAGRRPCRLRSRPWASGRPPSPPRSGRPRRSAPGCRRSPALVRPCPAGLSAGRTVARRVFARIARPAHAPHRRRRRCRPAFASRRSPAAPAWSCPRIPGRRFQPPGHGAGPPPPARCPTPAPPTTPDDLRRQPHLGRLMGSALRPFDARVLQLMARNVEVPLALSNLAAPAQVMAPHVHITRHLALSGDRLTDLARRAGMTKQAMAPLGDQCAAWGLVTRAVDPLDARARRVQFTAVGLAWLQAFRDAVAQAEAEFREEVGQEVATVVAIGLEAYAGA